AEQCSVEAWRRGRTVDKLVHGGDIEHRQVRVHGLNRAPRRRNQAEGIGAGAKHQGDVLHQEGGRRLRIWKVHRRRGRLVETVLLCVAHDSYDRAPGVVRESRLQALAEGLLEWPKVPRQALADDDDMRGGLQIVLVEVAAPEQWNTDRFEIVTADDLLGRYERLSSRGRFWLPLGGEVS